MGHDGKTHARKQRSHLLGCSFQRKTRDTTYEPNEDPRQTAGYRCDRRVAGLCNGQRGEGRERQATERPTGHGNSQRQQRLQRASQPHPEEADRLTTILTEEEAEAGCVASVNVRRRKKSEPAKAAGPSGGGFAAVWLR